jgi:hypothetical protein
MKTIFLIIGIIFFGVSMLKGQNYIGLTQSKIEKKFGQPDERGANYIIYNDNLEEGINKYYFDETGKCCEFVIIRTLNYLRDYQKMLDKDFSKTLEDTFISKSKSQNFKAVLSKSTNGFQIAITQVELAISPEHDIVCQIVK